MRHDEGSSVGTWPTYPAVYEINTWVWLRDLRQRHGVPITLGDVPQPELERLVSLRFDGIWLMGVWERSPASRRIAQENADLQVGYRRALPDGYTSADVIGSPYAIRDYRVDARLGGDAALAALRERLRQLGLLLILDFVPNHLAMDHAWAMDHPERFVQATEARLLREPSNHFRSVVGDRVRVFAHGRDPNFAGWSDTVQLDYRQRETRQAMTDTLAAVAEHCDGVRCDMAMLVTRDVFLRTWGGEFDPPDAEFWPAAISTTKAKSPSFLMLAEVYWDMEYNLLGFGFDYTYDKRLYDRLLHGDVESVRAHLGAGLSDQSRLDNVEYQRHLARFVENHDEQRAVVAFGRERSLAVAALALMLPGLRILYEGQVEGYRLKLPVQLGRRYPEPPDPDVESFYSRLLIELADPVLHNGTWQLLDPEEAWPANPSYRNVVAYSWTDGGEQRVVAVNMASERSQCYIPYSPVVRAEGLWDLRDRLSDGPDCPHARYGIEPQNRGLYLDLEGYDYTLLQLRPCSG